MEADLEPAIGRPAIDLVFALDAHLALLPAAAVVNNRAGTTLTCFAVTDINALRLARGDHLERPAMALSRSFHQHSSGSRSCLILPPSHAPRAGLGSGRDRHVPCRIRWRCRRPGHGAARPPAAPRCRLLRHHQLAQDPPRFPAPPSPPLPAPT